MVKDKAFNYIKFKMNTARDILSDTDIIKDGIRYSLDDIVEIASANNIKYYKDLRSTIKRLLKANSLVDRTITTCGIDSYVFMHKEESIHCLPYEGNVDCI